MKKSIYLLVMLAVVMIFSGCSNVYEKGVDYDDYPDKDVPIYDDAVVYEFDGDDEECTIKYGTEDDIDDVTEFYQEFVADEAGKIVVIKEKTKDDEYKLEALYDNYLFELEAEEPVRDLEKYYKSVVEVNVEEVDDDKAEEIKAKYGSVPVAAEDAPAETQAAAEAESTPAPEATEQAQQPAQQAQMSAEDLYLVGEDYYYGINGKEIDDAMALDYYVQSAELGYAPAYNMIGIMYESGYGVEQSYDEAFAYYKKSSDMGYSIGSSNVGLCYEEGTGALTSYSKAKQFYELAIQQDSTNGYAYYLLGNLYENGEGVTADYEIAAAYYKAGADLGDIDAMNAMGWFHYWGLGVNLDYKLAGSYFERAADSGDGYAMYVIGWMHERGEGYKEDNDIAFEYFMAGASAGSPLAQYKVGQFYELGISVDADRNEAIKYYLLGAEGGSEEAIDAVMRMVPRDEWPDYIEKK